MQYYGDSSQQDEAQLYAADVDRDTLEALLAIDRYIRESDGAPLPGQ